jgi:phage shock protein C
MGDHPKLVRSSRDRKLAGVCSGLARRYGWNLKRVRGVFIVAGCLGIGLIAYFFLWVFLRSDEHSGSYYPQDGPGISPEQDAGMLQEKIVWRPNQWPLR